METGVQRDAVNDSILFADLVSMVGATVCYPPHLRSSVLMDRRRSDRTFLVWTLYAWDGIRIVEHPIGPLRNRLESRSQRFNRFKGLHQRIQHRLRRRLCWPLSPKV